MNFKTKDIVKVLIPNVANSGYDYRLQSDANIGQFVSVSVMNRLYIGVIIGGGDSGLDSQKIKPVLNVFNMKISENYIKWILKMSEWTMMNPGAVLRLIINVPDAFLPPKTETLYEFIAPKKMSENHWRTADCFASNDNMPMTENDIKNIARVSTAVIKTMIKKDILKISETRDQRPKTRKYFETNSVQLNHEQQVAADTIETNKFNVFLLDGITGSGKTQVYFDTALRVYKNGKSVLLMMPEIALTAQFFHRFEKRFGAPPVIWHSNLTGARRREIWRGVANGDIKIIVGTRSALFLPWQDLGLIVVDEEHDGSYKQTDMGNYHARDMAILRAKIEDFPVILASATPALETMRNAMNGRYKHIKLTSRFGGATLPKIETIDMRGKSKIISDELHNALEQNLNAGEQSLLFINRRGYAPIVQCKKCGWVAGCDDCSVGMTLHKSNNKLICRFCGKTRDMPHTCPDCSGVDLKLGGVGIERVQEEIADKFPSARIAIVSSDTINTRGALERLVAKMENREIDIIIGTQILAKGHHFPNLTLVGVLESDSGLMGNDFRAPEKTFAQIFQVAGRAGRGDKPGRVMLQTYQPEHPVLRAICNYNRDELYALELRGREFAKMPPFGQLIAVIIEAEKEDTLKKFVNELSLQKPILNGAKIMGPIVAQMYRVRTWYRMRFLVVGGENAALQTVVSRWISRVRAPANVRIKIDVNPQDFM